MCFNNVYQLLWVTSTYWKASYPKEALKMPGVCLDVNPEQISNKKNYHLCCKIQNFSFLYLERYVHYSINLTAQSWHTMKRYIWTSPTRNPLFYFSCQVDFLATYMTLSDQMRKLFDWSSKVIKNSMTCHLSSALDHLEMCSLIPRYSTSRGENKIHWFFYSKKNATDSKLRTVRFWSDLWHGIDLTRWPELDSSWKKRKMKRDVK